MSRRKPIPDSGRCRSTIDLRRAVGSRRCVDGCWGSGVPPCPTEEGAMAADRLPLRKTRAILRLKF